MNSVKILIVDDEDSLRLALADAFRMKGYTTFEAANGREGLEVALREKPDVIFLDIIMPEMDGHAMFNELRKDRWGRSARVVFMSVLDDESTIASSIGSGGEKYLIKTNWSLKELIEKAQEFIPRQ